MRSGEQAGRARRFAGAEVRYDVASVFAGGTVALGKNFRLSLDVRPSVYRAHLAIDLLQDSFEGRLQIELQSTVNIQLGAHRCHRWVADIEGTTDPVSHYARTVRTTTLSKDAQRSSIDEYGNETEATRWSEQWNTTLESSGVRPNSLLSPRWIAADPEGAASLANGIPGKYFDLGSAGAAG